MGDVIHGHLFVISGPSGTGKGAICSGLAASTDAMLSVSMTTRAPRDHEEDGRDYFFVEKGQFEEVIAGDGFLEYAEVFGEYYGTPKAPAVKELDKGRDVILEIDVDGAMQVRDCMPDAVLVFIMPPSADELRKRIEGRGTETSENIARRLARADSEIAKVGEYDYCVVNSDLEKAIEEVLAIVNAEKQSEENECVEKLRVGADAEKIIKRYQTGNY